MIHSIATDDDLEEDEAPREDRYEGRFRQPALVPPVEPKRSIKELAALCQLEYKDGKVGWP